MSELKPCPFCGGSYLLLDGIMPNDEMFYHCESCDYSISVLLGDTRPIEDELQRKLDIAVEALNFIAYPPNEWDDPSDRAMNTLEEIEKVKDE